MATTLVVGVDLGATNVRAGLFDAQGRRLDARLAALETPRGPRTGLNAVIAEIESLLERNGSPTIAAIGVGATGPVDPRNGLAINPYAQPAWSMTPLGGLLADHFGVPVQVENDADTAALGEWWQGAGQGAARLLAVTLGTGIGTALIIDGEIYRGLDGAHSEGGHHVIDPRGPQCYCGARGCWESLAGGEALLAAIREEAAIDPDWARILGFDCPQDVSAGAVAQAARQKDPRSTVIMAREAYYLAVGLVNLVTMLAPQVVVLSGGLMQSFDLFEPYLRRRLADNSRMVPADQVQVRPAALGIYAGICGAAYVALRKLQPEINPSH